ncbi:MAG: orotidine-5'-phosphate decarboxylase [Nevskia sp.]|nr:orotidine-5'-phosphate decarboxylase [Nevskia sp.]
MSSATLKSSYTTQLTGSRSAASPVSDIPSHYIPQAMPIPSSAADRLIVALDFDSADEAMKLVKELGDTVTFYKVGLQLFMGNGLDGIVRKLTDLRKKVFLDLKIDDTPRTVENAVRNMGIDGVQFFTLQGNGATARAAKAGRGDNEFPKFLQVTYLSSYDQSDIREVYHLDDSMPIDLDDWVVKRTEKIIGSGCDGVIASGSSVKRLRQYYPTAKDLLIVSPGIRPEGTSTDDHKRSMTPKEAILAGSDYLVVGRPIRKAENPVEMAKSIQNEIAGALAELKQRAAAI